MEDIIVYAAIIISVIWSIIKNFQEQKKKDDSRTVGQPNQTTISEQPEQAVPAPFSRPARNRPEAVRGNNPSPVNAGSTITMNRSVLESSLESSGYTTLESTVPNAGFSDEERRAFQQVDGLENVTEIEEDNNKKQEYSTRKIHHLFETKDDLKKAILYTAILERKF